MKKIADLADVDTQLTRIAIQHLVYYGCIVLLDIFQFSNIYSINKKAALLLQSTALQKECTDFVSRFGKCFQSFNDLEAYRLPFASIFTLYTCLKAGLTIKNWIEENSKLIPFIDVRYTSSFD